MSEEGTLTPEVRIGQLEEALATETDRLKKLFAAYETQEKNSSMHVQRLKFLRKKSSTRKSSEKHKNR